MEPAYEFIKQTGGLVAEKDYPYTGKYGICNNAISANKVATITGYVRVSHNDETSLQVVAAVAKQSVSTAMDASGYAFQFYSHGIYTGPCTSKVNHGVVGYGGTDDANYWIVKNSWGADLGEEGYVRMQRGASDTTGLCGIAKIPSYSLKD